jgi:hypothetical protein
VTGLALALHAPDLDTVSTMGRAGALAPGRPIEIVTTDGEGAPGALRNRALAAATAPYIAFAVEPPRTAFLEVAARLLDGDPAVSFVTGWGDALPLRHDPSPRPATVAALLGRCWFSHTPALFRRHACLAAGGFDESLPGAEELDLLLRLLDGGRGLVVEDPVLRHRPWGTAPAPNAGDATVAAGRLLFEKHRARFEAHFAAILVAKERTVRELVERRRPR